MGYSELVNSACALSWGSQLIGQLNPCYNRTNPHKTMSDGQFNPSTMSFDVRPSGTTTKHGECFHEDGGKYAIFEEVLAPPVTLSSGRPSSIQPKQYRVISCACSKDKSLINGITDYCEYCLCRKCGGKHLPRDIMQQEYNNSNEPWINLEIVLLLMYIYCILRHCIGNGQTQTNYSLYIRNCYPDGFNSKFHNCES